MAAAADPAMAAAEAVKPYRVHVSSKYLDLTKQKLELTRLPHESSQPRSEDWWEPKPQVEPLIDYWLEKYNWREQENQLNNIPQFRTAISIPASETPLRLHFIHARSAHGHALPLLLIPPFPLSNLSFAHLTKPLTDPQDAANDQPFHVVIPSLPGLGFSDPFPNNTAEIAAAAEMLDTLMRRLSYPHYLATNAGAAQSSPAEIDWKLIDRLATHYPDSCVGAHFIAPPLASPKLPEAPWEWAKWSIANFFHAGILGYSGDDFAALKQIRKLPGARLAKAGRGPRAAVPFSTVPFGLNRFGLREPNTLAYALCDSPVGLLVFVLASLRLLGPRTTFTPDQILTFTQLAWVPGPEYAMRFWAHCAAHGAGLDKKKDNDKTRSHVATSKPRVAITVFLGNEDGAAQEAISPGDEEIPTGPFRRGEGAGYACPAWGNARYTVVHSQRVAGKPGLLAWERPEIIASGVRGLAREILKVDKRIEPPAADAATAPLERVVVVDAEPAASSSAPTSPAPAEAASAGGGGAGQLKPSAAEHGAGSARLSPASAQTRKGKEPEGSPSPVFLSVIPEERRQDEARSPFSEGESPDTLVVTTPSPSPHR